MKVCLDSQITSIENRTEVTQFILLGLTNAPELQLPLFILFSLIYLINVLGNLGVIMLILLDSRRHTPMYFFLSNLSLVDPCYSSAVTPTVLAGFLTGDNVISYNACAAQMLFFAGFASVENFLLASMAYDCYAAVFKPLHYTTTMTTGLCAHLAIGSYVSGFLNGSIHTGVTFHLSFCMSNEVHHFFCYVMRWVLSCSDRHVSEMVLVFASSFNIVFALLVILISYLLIFITVLKMHSSEGYRKALSTRASHFIAVSIFYGTRIFVCLQSSSSPSTDTDKMVSVFYTMVIPMINPLVYSLRNKDIHSTFQKVTEKAKLSLANDTCYHLQGECHHMEDVTPKLMTGFRVGDKVISYNACAAQILHTLWDHHYHVLQPNSSHSMDNEKVASVFYTVAVPMLNPLVYSLRKKEVKGAFKKVVEKIKLSQGLTF
ncbi:LOW QUALITY PROTEIN: olfactory receptor 5B3-like [Dugong dugon]